MSYTFFDIIRFITMFQFVFFGIFLLTVPKGNRQANRLFAVFLIGKALCYFDGFLADYLIKLPEWYFHLFFAGTGFEFLLGPALLLYVKSMIKPAFTLRRSHLIHLIPFGIYSCLYAWFYGFQPLSRKQEIVFGLNGSYAWVGTAVYMFIYLFFLLYSLRALVELRQYGKRLNDLYSNLEHRKFEWLFLLILGFMMIWGFSLLNWFTRSLFQFTIPIPSIVFIGGIFLFANFIVVKGLRQPLLFNGEPLAEAKLKYQKTKLSDAQISDVLEKLTAFMTKEKPYLDPDFSMKDLSERLKIPSHTISQVLNSKLGKNFFSYVNQYRIDESKKYLSETRNEMNILDILYSSGFNSKSSFNTAFKKFTGLTPSAFKEQLKSSTL